MISTQRISEIVKMVKDVNLEELIPVIFEERCNFSALINIPLDLVYSEEKISSWNIESRKAGTENQGGMRRMVNSWNCRQADLDFRCYAVRAGIGQYSLSNGHTGVIAKPTFIFRNPTEAEMQREFSTHPNTRAFAIPINEATKEEIKEKSTWEDGHPTFEYGGAKYLYVAEPLLVKIVCPARFFSGDMPEDVSSLVQDINSISIENGRIHRFIYHLYHAVNGNLKYNGFELGSEYSIEKSKNEGKVRMHKKGMFYYFKEKGKGMTSFSISKYLDDRTSILKKIKKERAEGDGTDDKYG